MTLSPYQRFAFRTFGRFVGEAAAANSHLRTTLLKARINLRPEVYLANSALNIVLGFAVTFVLVLLLAILRGAGLVDVPSTAFVILVPLPPLLAATIYLTTFILPDIKAIQRARDIDAKLPYALNYIAIMASAGVTIDRIFSTLSRQPVYGEISAEAGRISRDIDLLGSDILGALNAAIDRSPSTKFQDFLQGTIISISSGGDLRSYFRAKSDQFAYENRQDQKKFLDNLGVLAESFVTVVVAAPLFVIVILSVMTMMGGNGGDALRTGYIMVFALLPLAQFGFAYTIQGLTREP